MKRSIAVGFAAALWTAAAGFAQDSLVGTYKGSYAATSPTGVPVNVGVTLVIVKVEDGKVSGTGSYHVGPCSGDYPIQGVLKGGGIGVRSTGKGGAGGDCLFGFKGKIVGDTLVGYIGPNEVVLRK